MNNQLEMEFEMVTRKSPRRGISRLIHQHLITYAEQSVNITELMEQFDLKENQVQNSIHYLMERYSDHIEVVVKGRVWKWHESKIGSEETNNGFRVIGQSKKGYVVLEDEDGNLFKAVEI